MEFMGKQDQLERLEKHEAEYKESWKKEIDALHEMTALGDTAQFSKLNAWVSSDVAKATPQVLDDDDATSQGATCGFQNFVMKPTAQPRELTRRTRLQLIQKLLKANHRVETDTGDNDERDTKDDEKLPKMTLRARVSNTLLNEFETIDEIIYNAFHCSGSHQARLTAFLRIPNSVSCTPVPTCFGHALEARILALWVSM